MRMYDIIKKKRDGKQLSPDEINYFVGNYTKGNIPDYQASALLMAIYFNKMSKEETLDLTKAMIDSGDTFDLSGINGIKVDKHSTGGVGDTTTLILGPMVAACGVPFVKMSGRGLGHTGGTLDKLESIKGFRVELSNDEFVRNTNEINIAICSQTGNITPADKKLYALRDVTATVDNLSLIASSVMSKKLAIKNDGLILDVKVGSGAFMKNVEDAIVLAKEMVSIGNLYGRKTIAIVTDMDEPLGKAVGNALEVKEAIETLQGRGPEDITELCLVLGSKLLLIAGKVSDEEEGKNMLKEAIDSGKAYKKLIELVEYQNGDIEMIKNQDLLPRAKYVIEVKATENGYVKSINAEEVGKIAQFLGAGRETMDSVLDLSVGIILNKKVDDKVNNGDILAYIHSNDLDKANNAKTRLLNTFIIGEKNKLSKQLIYEVVE